MNQVFLNRIKEYFPERYQEYLKKLEEPCTKGFFINSCKGDVNHILECIDFDYNACDYTDESYYHNNDNIGKTKAYELGLIYPQEIGASLTSRYIDTSDVHTVVDLCAAPGGKTINIANRLKNDCLIISNDNSHLRASILSSNLERIGLDNVIVTSKEVSDLAGQLKGFADLVILDAPCSGEGMVRKYPEIIDNYSVENITELSSLQKKLLDYAYEIANENGYIIYSTCTYAPEEDENQVISFIERHPDIKIIPFSNCIGITELGAIKMSPLENTEGQFAVMMKKTSEYIEKSKIRYLKSVKEKLVDDFLKENLNIDRYFLYKHNDKYYISFIELPDLKFNVLKYSVLAGEIINKRFEPNHHLYRSNYLRNRFKYVYDLNDDEYLKYISGNEITINQDNHYYLLTYKGFSIGYGKCSNGQLKNKYPKGLRRVL